MVSFQDATLGADTNINIVFSETPNISARISEEFTARNLHLTSPGPSYVHLQSAAPRRAFIQPGDKHLHQTPGHSRVPHISMRS